MAARRDTLLAAQYFTGVAGMAAMRRCLTEPSTVRPRLDDIRAVVEHLDEFPNDLEIPVVEYDVDDGYAAWAAAYDGPNPAVDESRAVIASMLDDLAAGVALDAACGTGSQAEQLAARGHRVIGVDASEAMLSVARGKLPDAELRCGRLDALGLDDESVDLVTCTLALTHVPDLGPVLAEMARVLRPGGSVLLVDIHPTFVSFGGAAVFPTGSSGFELAFVRNLLHPVSSYVAAAHAAGLSVADCREPPAPDAVITSNPAHGFVPDAVRQAFDGLPFLLAWRLEKPS
jgi:2-polyprenyl-3-methyl-5-hydroxy-6-metoxy-1,4-benzoquinol methylase